MKDDFKDFVDNYKKDPEKVRQIKQSKLERKKNKPKKNLLNFRFLNRWDNSFISSHKS